MPLVRRTISMPQWLDQEICQVWGGMISSGRKATYSLTLASIILGAFVQLDHGYAEDTWNNVRAFLEGNAEIDNINADEWLREFREAVARSGYLRDPDDGSNQPPKGE